ncbi:MAG: LamG-like jellyroll fold domain-containing protein [Bacteroidota bacterium]
MAVLLAAVATGQAPLANAQFVDFWMPDRVKAGENVQAFARWGGQESADGLLLQLPEGMQLRHAQVLQSGRVPVKAGLRGEPRGGYRVTFPDGLRGGVTLAFTMAVGSVPGTAAWSVTPYMEGQGRAEPRLAQPGLAARGRLTVEPRPRTTDNHALRLADSTATAVLRPAALPDLGTQAAFTLEFWMRSLALSEVVASTWTGDENDPYPLDMVVDGQGQLVVYRGQPGEHQAMTSRRPIADGQWHHVALVNDPETRWSRLFLNGTVVDSLFNRTQIDIRHDQPLALGRRVPATAVTPADQMQPYTGWLDEVRLWPGARPAPLLRQMMREPVVDAPTGTVVLNFDKEAGSPSEWWQGVPQGLLREPSNLAFFHPVRGLSAELTDQAVELEWRADATQIQTFVIERSGDGVDFEPVGQVIRSEDSAQRAFVFQDLQPDFKRQVLYYRVRQRFTGGAERVSGVLKVGIADAEQPGRAVLIGNYPNPFNPLTTVEYQVNETVHVSLSVWDLAGQRVRNLVDEEKTPGTYQVGFEAVELPSGTYFVRLQLAEGTQYHKMTLTK